MSEKAAGLRALHVGGDPLVLANAWDAASARMVEAAGFAAVATTPRLREVRRRALGPRRRREPVRALSDRMRR